MTTVVIIALVIVALAGTACGYVYGYSNGSASALHPDGPETCRAKLRAVERSRNTWKARARHLEQKYEQLEHSMTVTGEWLLSEIDEAHRARAVEARS